MMISEKIISRRSFLKATAALGSLLFSGCSFNNSSIKKAVSTLSGNNMADTEFVRQIITADSQTSRTIMWQSSAPQENAIAVLREKGSEKTISFPAISMPYNDDGQHLYLHTSSINGLTPGKKYEYHLQNGNETSAWYNLSTDNGDNFKAIIFPDTQCNDYSVWQSNAKAAFASHPEAAFFLNLGDLVDNGEDHYQWNNWFSAVENISCDIPFAPVMGNHETYDKKWKVRLPFAYLNEFAVPPNGNTDFDRYYYSFEYGNVYFAVLNTQLEEIGEFKDNLLENEIKWLHEDASRTTKKWKVALLHKDVLRYAIKNRPERTAGISDIGRYFMPILEELDFDLVLTAHLHTYRNRGHLKNFISAETGPVYLLTGNAGNIFYNGFWLDHPLDKVKAPQPEKGNYLLLSSDKETLTIKSCLITGECFDETVIKKS